MSGGGASRYDALVASIEPATLLAPFDAARARALRLAGRPGRALLRSPSRRAVLYAALSFTLAAWLALAFPFATFALAPLVLGVPHLLADARYLVLRPELHRRTALVVATAPALAAAAFAASPAIGLSAVLSASLVTPGPLGRKAVAATLSLALVAVAARWPLETGYAFVHAHNLVAVVFVIAIFARRPALESLPFVALAAFTIAVGLGAFDGSLLAAAARSPRALVDEAMLTAAPTETGLTALRLVAIFVLLQGVHYAAWLRMIPETARERPGVRGFASSLAALRRDCGAPLLLATAALGLGLAAYAAASSVVAARLTYLHLAAFHGPLELAALAVAFVGGRSLFRPRRDEGEYEKDSRSCPPAAAAAGAPTEPVDMGAR